MYGGPLKKKKMNAPKDFFGVSDLCLCKQRLMCILIVTAICRSLKSQLGFRVCRVARFFLIQTYQTGKKYQKATDYTKRP
jgi:hypothetical protein